MNFAKFARVAPFVTESTWQQLLAMPKPMSVEGAIVPLTLDGLTWGQLIELQGCGRYMDLLAQSPCIILGLSAKQRDGVAIETLAGLANFVKAELERIAKLWAECHVPPTAEEQRAGVETLNFGVFGLVDWFAHRQGLSNHDDCLKVPWLTVWQCLKIDSARTMYERRLHKAYTTKK